MSDQKWARVAGVLYLIIIVCGLFSEGVVRMGVLNPSSASETAANIANSELLYRFGFVADLFMVGADLAVAVIFYHLLKSISQPLALLAALFRFVQAAIIGMNMLNHFRPLLLLNRSDIVGIFGQDQIHQMILLALESHKTGYQISQVFFSFNCLLMGYLLFQSKKFPQWLGIAIGLASLAYFSDAMINFLKPSLADSFSVMMVVPAVAEISFCLWLLIKGVKEASSPLPQR